MFQLIDYLRRIAPPPSPGPIAFVERDDGAEGADPRATTASENGGSRQATVLVVDVAAIRPRQLVQVFATATRARHSELAGTPESDAGNAPPFLPARDQLRQLDQRIFA